MGAVHALSHALGGLARPVLHHGTLNSVFLPAVLRFNADACVAKYGTLRAALGLGQHQDIGDYVAGLSRRLGIPSCLEAMGVSESSLAAMVPIAIADPCTQTNPRPPTPDDYGRLLVEAFTDQDVG